MDPIPPELENSIQPIDGRRRAGAIRDHMHETLDALLEYVRQNERVCPAPLRWHVLWKMLRRRRCAENGRETGSPPNFGRLGGTRQCC